MDLSAYVSEFPTVARDGSDYFVVPPVTPDDDIPEMSAEKLKLAHGRGLALDTMRAAVGDEWPSLACCILGKVMQAAFDVSDIHGHPDRYVAIGARRAAR